MAEQTCDVLVVGSGGAGLAAAIEAARSGASVLVATKLGLASSNTAKAQGGIQAAVGADDSPEIHAADVIASSHETADPRLVAALTGDAPDAISWLESIGVSFDRDDGRYRVVRCGGATRRRLLQVGDRTGHAIATALRRTAQATSGIELRDHAPLLAVHAPSAPSEGAAPGFVEATIDSPEGPVSVRTGALVLAAGGRCWAEAKRLGELSTNGAGATGEVTEMALAAGCLARDLDALQHHPTGGLWPLTMQGYSIPETTRAYGALLLNGRGERFVDELAARDVVAAAIVRECAEGRGVLTPEGRTAVYLDCRPIPVADAERSLPFMLRRFRHAGIDPLTEPLLTYPVLHYQNGGLVIDEEGRTTVPGIYAAGEITGGVHGRNRMMGNSLLDLVVFGRRAGRTAAAAA